MSELTPQSKVWFGLFSVGGYDYPIVASSEFMVYRIAGRIYSKWFITGMMMYDRYNWIRNPYIVSFKGYAEYVGFRVEEMEINSYLSN